MRPDSRTMRPGAARLVWAMLLLAFWIALGLGRVAVAGLVRRSDTRLGQLSEFALLIARSCHGIHLRSSATLVHPGRVGLPLDHRSRQVIVCAVATSQWGWRVPFRRVLRVMFGWRWWVAVIFCSLACSRMAVNILRGHSPRFGFASDMGRFAQAHRRIRPYRCSWLTLLAWAAALFSSDNPTSDSGELVAVPALISPPDTGRREMQSVYLCPREATTASGTPDRDHAITCSRP